MLNSFSGIGRLGSDPEINRNGESIVAKFDLAINEFFKKNGDLQKKTHWIPCVSYGRMAEICGEFLKKGSQVGVRGSLKASQFEGKNGQSIKRLQIHVSEVEFLQSRSDGKEAPFVEEEAAV